MTPRILRMRLSSWAFGLLALVGSGFGNVPDARAVFHEEEMGLGGPSFHVALGFRNGKSPRADEIYSGVFGIKIAPVTYVVHDAFYLSFVAPGIHLEKNTILALSFSPIIASHESGVGFAIDFFLPSSREDRPGGVFGLSLNLDVFQFFRYIRL